MADKIRIRYAKKADIEGIYNLGKKTKELKFSNDMNFHDKKEFLEFVGKPKDNILLVACSGKDLAGFLYAKIVSSTWCILDNLVVDSNYRKHGIGTSPLNKLYERLRKERVNYIQILEDIHQKRTRKFWRDNGFREEKVFVWADKVLRQL